MKERSTNHLSFQSLRPKYSITNSAGIAEGTIAAVLIYRSLVPSKHEGTISRLHKPYLDVAQIRLLETGHQRRKQAGTFSLGLIPHADDAAIKSKSMSTNIHCINHS